MSEEQLYSNDKNKKAQCDQCIVGELLARPFVSCDQEKQIELFVFFNGPRINSDSQSPLFKKKLMDWYSKYPWLTCCEHLKRLFCWICLMFNESDGSVWTVTGFNVFSYLTVHGNLHQNSTNHLESMNGLMHLKWKIRSSVHLQNILSKFHSIERRSLEPSQQEKDLFKKLVDANCIEILKRQNEPKKKSKSQNMTTCINDELNGMTVNSLYKLMSDRIIIDVEDSPFFSLTVNTIRDVTQKTYYAIIFRYVSPESEIMERVLKVAGYSKENPDYLQTKLYEWLAEMNKAGKLISISFDGGVKTETQISILKSIREQHYENAIIVNCYNHRLNLVIQQSVDHIPSCRSFFQTVSKLALFFSNSKRRKKAFFTVIGEHGNDKSSLFTTNFFRNIHENFDPLTSLLKKMFKDVDEWDGATKVEAMGFYETFRDFDFRFILSIFVVILPAAEELQDIVNKNVFQDHSKCWNRIEEFMNKIEFYIKRFEEVWFVVNKLTGTDEPHEEKAETYKNLYLTILESISNQVKEVYTWLSRFQFTKLLNPRKFFSYSQDFPEKELASLNKEFPEIFDIDRLRTQLGNFYAERGHNKLEVQQLQKYLMERRNRDSLDQVIKLVSFTLVFPLCELKGNTALAKMNSYLVSTGRKITEKSMVLNQSDYLCKIWKEYSFYDALMIDFINLNLVPKFYNSLL